MCRKLLYLTSFMLAVGTVLGLANSAQAENIILTFSDLGDEGGEVEIAADYQPSELARTGITTTWTGWSLFNDDVMGEGLRDHTETWDPGFPSVYVYTSDDGGSLEFSSAVEIPSIWIFQDPWAATAVAGYLGNQELWSVPADHPEQWVEITEGAGQAIDAIIVSGGYSRIDDITIKVGDSPLAFNPDPQDGALHAGTWANLSWSPGDFAVSHDVYFGENFDDVNNGNGDTFRGNQAENFTIVGFFGYPYPDGLVPGTIYYWRIDEVNDAEPNSPWKGPVWSFSIPPRTAYSPNPADGAEFVDLNVQLKWTAGLGTILHYVFFGDNFDEVSNAATGTKNGTTSYSPGPLKLAKTYYWRVDESDGFETYKGQVWSFTTEGAVSGPNPADSAVDIKPSIILSWVAGEVAGSHEVYFGTNADDVKNATKASPEYMGTKALGEESYDPGKLILNTMYYWRIDEVNGTSPDSPWAGNVWSFMTGDFLVIDDFENYDAIENQIWYAWHDGLGYGTPGTADYFAGNGTGAAVGDETTASYTEETFVHGGSQSMPVVYNNNIQGYSKYSEVEYTLTGQRDWTEEDVAELSLWFRGYHGSVGSFVEGPVGTYTGRLTVWKLMNSTSLIRCLTVPVQLLQGSIAYRIQITGQRQA